MTPGTANLEIYRGDTSQWVFVLWADAGSTVPFDLTGYTVEAEIRETPAGALLVTLATLVELPNTITVTLDAEASATLPATSKVASWDLQLTSLAGAVTTVVKGNANITVDVTDSAPAQGLAQRR